MSANIQKKKGGPDRHPVAPWMFLAPYLLYAAVFFVYPLLYAGWLAFHQTDGPHTAIFVGLDNFKFIFSDSMFWKAMSNTTIYAIASICIQLPISLGLAMLLNNSNSRMKGAFRLMIFSPNLVGQIFVGVMFAVIFTPHYGLFNKGLDALVGWGLEKQWLADPNLLLPALIIISLWMYVGYNMIYFLAGLQSVDKQLIEAAQIDGASSWQTFLHITLPQIKPIAIFVVIMSTIGSYQLFELPFALMKGEGFGPNNAAMTVVGYLYEWGFNNGDLGTAAAIGWILAAIIFVISIFQLKVTHAYDVD
jgi:ABC-type sugar transport system permease subunit